MLSSILIALLGLYVLTRDNARRVDGIALKALRGLEYAAMGLFAVLAVTTLLVAIGI